MAAIRYHSEYVSFTGDQYRIEIWDSEHTGDSTEFTSGQDGFSLRYEGEGSSTESTVLATSCDIDFYIENVTHEALITDISASEEGRFMVRILWTASDLKFWHGMLLPDIGSYEEAYYPYVLKLKATDGLASLKDVDYNDDGDEYTGKQTLLQHLLNCLTKLPYIDTFYGSGDNFVSSYIDWWETRHTHNSGSQCALSQTYADHAAFITYEKSTPKFLSCYEVITNIMTTLRARITSANGSFWVEQMSYRTASTVIGRGYTKTGTFLGTGNFSGANVINQTAGGALEAVGTYEFMAPIKKHSHTFKSLLRRNFLSGIPEWNDANTADSLVYKPIEANGNKTTLRITGNLNITIGAKVATGIVMPPFVMEFNMRLKIGDKYLRRSYSLTPDYQITYYPTLWTTLPDYIRILKPIDNGILLSNQTTLTFTFAQPVDIMTVPLEEGNGFFYFGFNISSLTRYDGSTMNLADYNISYSFNNHNIQAYSEGAPISTEDEIEYPCLNTLYPKNSLTTESVSLLGTATDVNTFGALWVQDGANKVLANSWGEGVEATDKYIEKLIAETTVSARAVPNRVLNGALVGNIVAMSRLHWIGEKWILMGGTWDAHNDRFSGEWFELNYADGLTTSPAIKKTLKVLDTQVPDAPISGGSNSSYELTAKPPATILTPLSLTGTGAALMLPLGATSQTVTTIPISEILTDGDLYVGDTIAIINPLSGEWDELTVTATTEAGDTSIAVSGTLNANYPINSTIFKKPKIGQFTLGPGIENTLTYWNAVNTVAGIAKTYILPDEARFTDFILKIKTALSSSEMWLSADAQGSKIQSYGSLPLYINKEGNPVFMPSIAGSGTRMVTVTGTGELSNAAIPSAGITGTLTAPRIPVASGAGTLVDYDDLRWDNTTKGIRAGGGAGAVVGTYTAYPSNGHGFYAFASVSGSVYGTLENFWDAAGAGNSYWLIKVGGANAGDPYTVYVISGVISWAVGIDNSDNDIFKIGPYSNPGTGALGLQIRTTGEAAFGGTPDTAISLRIATAKPLGLPNGTDATRATGNSNPNMQWNSTSGRLEAISPGGGFYKPIVSYTQPTISVSAPAGTGATCVVEISSSNAVAGTIRLTTGTGPTSGALLTVTVSGNMGGGAFTQLTARNSAAAGQMTNFYISASGPTTFTISVNSALAASTAYILNYRCDG